MNQSWYKFWSVFKTKIATCFGLINVSIFAQKINKGLSKLKTMEKINEEIDASQIINELREIGLMLDKKMKNEEKLSNTSGSE